MTVYMLKVNYSSLFLFLIPSIVLPLSAYADENKKDFVFSIKPFVSTYDFKYSFDSSKADSRYGSPTSVIDFNGLSYSGVSFLFDFKGKKSYRSLEFSISSGSKNSGKMIDDDYYSPEFAGTNNPTRFSRTISEAAISKTYSLKYGSGFTIYFDDFFLSSAKYGIGIKGIYNEFSAYGITVAEDPYNLYGDISKNLYGNDTEVLKIKNYQLLNSFDFFAEKKIGQNISLSSNVNLIYLGNMLTKDYHLKRDDLGSPSFKITSLMYGFDVGVSALYDIEPLVFSLSYNYSLIKPYSYRKIAEVFNSEQESIGGVPTVSHDFKQEFYSFGVGYRF